MKKRINVLLIAFIVLGASCWAFRFFEKHYKANNEIILPAEQKVYKQILQEQDLTDEQIIELKSFDPERQKRSFNLGMMITFGITAFFCAIYIVFEFFVHGKSPKKK